MLICTIIFSQTETRISKVEFVGNDFYSSNNILEMMNQKSGLIYNPKQLELDLQNIIKNYQQEGFLNTSLSDIETDYNLDSSSVNISFHINESKRTTIGEIIFEGNKLYPSAYLQKQMYLKPGKVFSSVTLASDVESILSRYEEKGYPFASVNIKDISEYSSGSENKLKIIIAVDENEKIKIDDIVIEGNTDTKKDVILREIRLPENKLVTKESLLEIKRRLENLGYFESVSQPKILKYKASTVLLIKVKEGGTNTFDGIVGYNPPAQNEDKGYFTGLVNLSLKNLFGTGRRIDARWQKEQKQTQELNLRYLEPWVFGIPLNAGIDFLQRVQDSTYVRRNVGLKGDALITSKFTVSGLLKIDRVIPTNGTAQTAYTIFDSRLMNAGVELSFDSRDYVYNPTSGMHWKTGYIIGQKKIYNFASYNNIPRDFTVHKYTGDFEFFTSFFKRQSLLIALHGGEIRSPKLENADYFRYGGTRTVRGYREEQFLASQIVWSNLELRYALSRKTFASVFYDIGWYRRPADELTLSPEQKETIYGYGLGIRVETALGIFGVSYALGKGDTPLEGKIHFGLINDF